MFRAFPEEEVARAIELSGLSALNQLVKAAALDDAAALESQDEVAAPEQRGAL